MRFHDTGPVVLLFTDGTAGLLTGINAEHKVVFVKDPRSPASDAPVAGGRAAAEPRFGLARRSLLRASRGYAEADAPFSLRWLFGLVMEEKRSLREIGLASFSLSMLTIFPPFLVMTVVDKVLTHSSVLHAGLDRRHPWVAIVYETLLGYARRLIMLVVGTRIDARINLHVFNRLLRLPLDYFERHPAGETMYKISQIHRVREFITGRLLTAFLDLMTLCVLLPFLFWLNATLAWIVLACACVITMIILVFLRPLRGAVRRVVRPRRTSSPRWARPCSASRRSSRWRSSRSARRCGTSGSRKPANGAWPTASWQLAADADDAGRAVHVDRRDPARRLSGAVRHTRHMVGALFAFMMLSQRVAQPLVQLARLIDDYEDVGAGDRTGGFRAEPPARGRRRVRRPAAAIRRGDHLRRCDLHLWRHQDAGTGSHQLLGPRRNDARHRRPFGLRQVDDHPAAAGHQPRLLRLREDRRLRPARDQPAASAVRASASCCRTTSCSAGRSATTSWPAGPG